jgi:dipeptidyl aminopeptidase/acylaminoacyl peptidase
MQPFRPEDILKHRTPRALCGGAEHAWLAFGVARALREEDDYESTLWGLRLDRDERPRRLTSPAFAASSPQFDRRGRRLAFLSKRDDSGKQVHLLPMDGGEARQLTSARERLSSIEAWSPDDTRLLVTASVTWVEDGEDRDGSKGRPPQVTRYLPYKRDGAGIIVGERTHLFAVDAEDGRLTALTSGDFDVASGAWSPDGRRLAIVRHRGGRMRHRSDLWLADADGADARLLVEELASISAMAWSPDGRWIALAAGRVEGESMVGIWLADARTGAVRRLGGEDLELNPSGTIVWHHDGTRLAAVAEHRGIRQIVSIAIPSGEATRLQSGLRAVQGIARAGKRLAFIATSMRKLEEVYSIDWEGGDERRHTALNRAWFRDRPRPHVAKRRFRVPDGDGGSERIDAWVLRPAQGEPPYPLLVDLHGGPHSEVLVDFAAHAYWYLLLSEGWAIVAPNAVGSGSYGRDFSRRLLARWGELDLPQVEAVVRTLQEEGLADDRVACAGKSYGGFLSAWAAGHSELFRAAVVAAPVASIESHAGTSDTGYYVTPYAMQADLNQDPDLYHRLSPLAYCRHFTAATLILQGENDGRCPRGQAEELFAHLIRCSEAPVELVVYPESSHGEAESGRPSNRIDYHGRLAKWVQEHAGARRTERDRACEQGEPRAAPLPDATAGTQSNSFVANRPSG